MSRKGKKRAKLAERRGDILSPDIGAAKAEYAEAAAVPDGGAESVDTATNADAESVAAKSGAQEVIEYYTRDDSDDSPDKPDNPEPVPEDGAAADEPAGDGDIIDVVDDADEDITEITDEPHDIRDVSYGVSGKIRIAATYVITLAVCAGIIAGAYRLAISGEADQAQIDAALAVMREDEDYKSVLNEKESIEYEVEKLRTTTENKKKNVDGINDGDNTKADLRAEIEEKRSEYVALTQEVKDKEEELEKLKTKTDTNKSSIVTLSPGTYTVGKQIAAGKYNVTGSGKFVLAKDGENLQNTVLSSNALEVSLENESVMQIDSTAKFTPAD